MADVDGMHACTYSEVYVIFSHLPWCIFHQVEASANAVMCVCVCVPYDLLVNGCVLLLNLQQYCSTGC